jgi:hypothetical protein
LSSGPGLKWRAGDVDRVAAPEPCPSDEPIGFGVE